MNNTTEIKSNMLPGYSTIETAYEVKDYPYFNNNKVALLVQNADAFFIEKSANKRVIKLLEEGIPQKEFERFNPISNITIKNSLLKYVSKYNII